MLLDENTHIYPKILLCEFRLNFPWIYCYSSTKIKIFTSSTNGNVFFKPMGTKRKNLFSVIKSPTSNQEKGLRWRDSGEFKCQNAQVFNFKISGSSPLRQTTLLERKQ